MKKILLLLSALTVAWTGRAQSVTDSLIVRIAEIEVYPACLDAYFEASKEVGRRAVEAEQGVVCLLPVRQKDDSTHVRVIEIYRSPAAYQLHLTTAHFLKYKESTRQMVKSLHLSEFVPLDPKAFPAIFKKL